MTSNPAGVPGAGQKATPVITIIQDANREVMLAGYGYKDTKRGIGVPGCPGWYPSQGIKWHMLIYNRNKPFKYK